MNDEPNETGRPPDEVIPPGLKRPPPPPPPRPSGTARPPEPETISDRVQKAREVIPVGERGPTPANYAQWIDIAKDVCKAYLLLPEHLHNNPSVVAGLREISARFNLSPYLFASQTYVQNDRLCFMATA